MKSASGLTFMGTKKGKEAGRSGIAIRRFLVMYIALMAVFFFFTSFKPVLGIIDVNGLFAKVVFLFSSKILCLLHHQCVSQGSIIALPGLSLDVGAACSGLDAVIMYSVAVLAYPAPWKRKLVGILSGAFIIQAANLLRIVALSYIGIYMKGAFEFVHIYIAQGMMIALGLGIFFIYLANANRSQQAHH